MMALDGASPFPIELCIIADTAFAGTPPAESTPSGRAPLGAVPHAKIAATMIAEFWNAVGLHN
jgi:hypothetical protein